MNIFLLGFRAMLPITTGVIPFGAVMGTVCANANLSVFQTVSMNFLVFAGASQLAAVDLMLKNAADIVVVATGLIINFRFVLYSAAISPVVQKFSLCTKLATSYLLTDQNYAVMSAHQSKLSSERAKILFYFGCSFCMLIAWHLSVLFGFVFGNFAPSSWSLEFAVPLSFASLVIPTLKNRIHIIVALFSFATSLLLTSLPYKLGLVATAFLSISLAYFLTLKRQTA